MRHSRRRFLQQVSAAAGFLTALPRGRSWAAPLGELVPVADEALLRTLALKAIDAARAAGGEFADIRIGAGRLVDLTCRYAREDGGLSMYPPWGNTQTRYGIRAIVDGAWGFASSSELSVDAVADVARRAVAVARANRPRRPRPLPLAPAPVVSDGQWATPIERDPFVVPLETQVELLMAALAEAAKLPATVGARLKADWRQAVVVFASTDGTLVTQRLAQAYPRASVSVRVGTDLVRTGRLDLDAIRRRGYGGGYGYEILDPETLVADMRALAERAAAQAREGGEAKSVEPGRYDLVFSAEALAQTLVPTVATALDLGRVLGYRADDEGTSFAAPPSEVLGRLQIASPLLTLRADRTRPHGAATVGWDVEGVKPEEYTVVRDGVVADYHTSRETAVELAGWYRQRGESTRSHGCARGIHAEPMARVPNLTVQPGSGGTVVGDLIADTKRGFYIEGASGSPDQQVLSAQFGTGEVRRITNGKLGETVKDAAFQFITSQLWKSLDAIGGQSSAVPVAVGTDARAMFDAIDTFCSTVQTVPARFRRVNVLNVGRTA